jgi:transcriptional regulator GlxA family with amidase domain
MVYGIFDVLWSAGRLWNPTVGLGPGEALFDPRIVAAAPGPLKLVTGVEIIPQDTIETLPTTDIVFVPNVVVMTPEEVAALDRRLIDWIGRMHRSGVPIYASCGGPIVLAEAGLLDGQETTTHWGYAPLFRQRFPQVNLQADRLLTQSGPGHDIVCSGGASSWQDLCLLLIARHAGIEEALRVSKLFLFQWHRDGQLPYATMIRNSAHSDGVIARCQEWIAQNYDCREINTELLKLAKLPKRTFDRRFKGATGYSPLAYVQAMRIEEAKHLLETGDQAVDAIGRMVGYEDVSSFRRLFRRNAGMSPAAYRRKFQAPKWIGPRTPAPQPGATAGSVPERLSRMVPVHPTQAHNNPRR